MCLVSYLSVEQYVISNTIGHKLFQIIIIVVKFGFDTVKCTVSPSKLVLFDFQNFGATELKTADTVHIYMNAS